MSQRDKSAISMLANRGQFLLSEMPLALADFLEEFDGVQISKQDIAEFAKGGQRFDACILLTVSEHFNDPLGAFEAIANCLKPGGEIFLTHGNFWAGPPFGTVFAGGLRSIRFGSTSIGRLGPYPQQSHV